MSFGRIAEFGIHKDDWRLYFDRLEQYFIVNKIPSELQVPLLITVMDVPTYELLVNLCAPAKPKTKTFEQITLIMEKHFQSKPSELAERYKFRNRIQLASENIEGYVDVLKKMSKTCEFGAWFEESLRDQFVCGIKSDTIRQRLFAEAKLDFMKAYNLAVSMEAAEIDAAPVVEGSASATREASLPVDGQPMMSTRWSGAGGSGSGRAAGRLPAGEHVHRSWPQAGRPAPATSRRRQERQERQCRACGGPHEAAACKFGRYVCRVCNMPGHLRRMCPRLTQHYTDESEFENVIVVSEDSEDSEDSDEDVYVKPVMKRILRRRANEPAPAPEKRRKPLATTLTFQLDERDIEADLRAISRHSPPPRSHHVPAHNSTQPRKHLNSSSCESPVRDGGETTETRVEDGKLLYERRWYHRGQSVSVEGRDMPKFPGHIHAITDEAIWVKKTNLERVRIYISQLARGKITLKRRAS